VKHTTRFFSKLLVGINITLCWLTVFFAVYYSQGEVAITALSIIAAVIGTYIGVGHMDYRAVLQSMKRDVGMGGYYPSADPNTTTTTTTTSTDTSGQDQ